MANEKSVSSKPTPETAEKTTLQSTQPAVAPTDALTASSAVKVLPPNSETGRKLPMATVQAGIPDAATETKMAVATKIFTTMRTSPGVTRKQVIEKFMAEAKLSKAGASTYYQLIQAKMR